MSVFFFERRTEPSFGILQQTHKLDREIAPVASTKIVYVLQSDCGKFDPEIVEMFHVIFPFDGGGNYTEPDSMNTRIFWIDRWHFPDAPVQYVLVETSAGYLGGTCGYEIKAGMYYQEELKWKTLISDCGLVDSVFPLKHNGICDFTVSYRWQDPVRYQYNGVDLVPTKNASPVSDTVLIAHIIDSVLKTENMNYIMEYVVPRLEWTSLYLDSTANPYFFIQYGMDGLFIIREESPHEFGLVNFLEKAVEVDIQNKVHKGIPDIRTTHTDYTDRFYRWNGQRYELYRSEPWVCPA